MESVGLECGSEMGPDNGRPVLATTLTREIMSVRLVDASFSVSFYSISGAKPRRI